MITADDSVATDHHGNRQVIKEYQRKATSPSCHPCFVAPTPVRPQETSQLVHRFFVYTTAKTPNAFQRPDKPMTYAVFNRGECQYGLTA